MELIFAGTTHNNLKGLKYQSINNFYLLNIDYDLANLLGL